MKKRSLSRTVDVVAASFRQMNKYIKELNKSKIFAGFMIVVLNIASKYVTIEVSSSMESYLRKTFSKQLLFFAIMWFGTRDIYVAFFGSVFVIIVIDYLMNEKSKFCCLTESFIRENNLPEEQESPEQESPGQESPGQESPGQESPGQEEEFAQQQQEPRQDSRQESGGGKIEKKKKKS